MKPWSDMPDHARIWVYQSSRFLTPDEVLKATRAGEQFMNDWSSHGKLMDASLELKDQLFLLIAVDEQKAAASGCGIDKSVRFVQDLGAFMGIDFMDRKTVAYKTGDTILLEPVHSFWAMRKAETIGPDTLVYDNLVRTVGEWKTRWCIPFAESWHQEVWGR